MPLFRKKRDKSQAERLAEGRLSSIPSRDFSSDLGDLIADLGGGRTTSTCCAGADLQPQAVARGVEQVLRLADEYDENTGQA